MAQYLGLRGRAIDEPNHIQHPADILARKAVAFRRLSPDEQVRAIKEKIREGHLQMEASPNRTAIEAEIEANERAWQETHRRIFEEFGF
jgi:hypothetical protein